MFVSMFMFMSMSPPLACSWPPQDLDQACKLFLKARSELASIKDTLDLSGFSATAAPLNPAQPPAAAAAAADGVSAKVVPELCWDENMNNHLIPAVPPRNIKVRMA
jgi:hypothetical protein